MAGKLLTTTTGGQMEDEKKLLQWHSAFFASIQIELAEESGHLIFESEHNLSTKPMQIDVLIIKKNTKEKLQKNIGRIFRKYNIIEYKSPEDYLSIDDFYKVYGYTCFYKADTGKSNEIKVEELTISFVCRHYPRKLVRHLEQERYMTVERQEDGIYYIRGGIFLMQLIVASHLPEETNLWLKNLTNDIKESKTAEKLVRRYGEHEKDILYQSVMDIIVRANKERFMEVSNNMCNALMELMKDKLDEREALGEARGEARGETRMGKLVNMLLSQNKIEEIKKVTTDDKIREEYYTLYNI